MNTPECIWEKVKIPPAEKGGIDLEHLYDELRRKGRCPLLLRAWESTPPWSDLQGFAWVVVTHAKCLLEAAENLDIDGCNAAEALVAWAVTAAAAEALLTAAGRAAKGRLDNGFWDSIEEAKRILKTYT